MKVVVRSVVLIFTLSTLVTLSSAQESADYVPAADQFAPIAKARYLSGELVYIDPVNRRGAIRMHDNYWSGPAHYFALLPYATVRYNGAYAELRDLPLGTVVHGYFTVPPKGEENTIPPLPDEHKKAAIPHNHGICLEDDFSFYQRQGQSWEIVSIDIDKEKINVEPAGEKTKDGINTPYTFDIDTRTRIWKDRRLSDLGDIETGTTVQLNLTWAQGWGQKEFRVGDIWLDDISRKFATEMQRRRHLRYERQRWTPGWIDDVELFDFGGGIVTLTLFEVDRELIADLRRDKNERIAVAVAEKTRRTWIHRADRKFAKLVEWKDIKDSPLGSSGVQLRVKFTELLAGYKRGRCVRVKAENWKWVSVPPEERITSREEQEQSARMVLPF
ncbi:MAG TPA: hypothetical protein DCE55_09830 [Planctomycetaceae bacterium]|nr:hypothetical protein [Planctomycetaceae bacterium]